MNIVAEMYTPSYLIGEPSLLTEENLTRHSTKYPAVTGKAGLMDMFHASLEQENKRRLRRSRRFPTLIPSPVDQNSPTPSSSTSSSDPSSRRSIRVSTNNVAIGAKTMPFPYHNDAIFLPTAESPPPPHFDTVSLRSSIPPSLVQSSQRRPPSPVWWRKNESQSRSNVLRFSHKSSDIPHEINIPEKPKRKTISRKAVCHWCQKTWLRIIRQ